MAEIKSTMEMVLERAAKMAENAPTQADDEVTIQSGMRLAARFMNGEDLSLHQELAAVPPEDQASCQLGMIKTLLRNVVLPRDEELRSAGEKALVSITGLNSSQTIQATCQELGQILAQYNQHKDQATKQLEDAIIDQLQQQAMAAGQPTDREMNPAMHPKYHEELNRVLVGLNGQYNQAMEQRKEIILQQFSV